MRHLRTLTDDQPIAAVHGLVERVATALDSSGPNLGTALLHLGILVLAYAVIARLALRRFAGV